MVKNKGRSLVDKKISHYALGNSIVITLGAILTFYLLFGKNNLVMFVIIFIFALLSNSLFFIYLLKDLGSESKNLLEVGRHYLLVVQGISLVFLIIAYFLVPIQYLFLFLSPMVGTVTSLIIPFFYRKRRKK